MEELTTSTGTAIRNNSIIFEQNTDTAGIRRDTYMIDMNRTALYYIAAALWGTPGVIITIKGVEAYLTMPGRKLWWLILITAAVLAGFFGVNITFTKLITNLRMCDSLIYISHKELFFTNKLMTRIEISPMSYCKILGS